MPCVYDLHSGGIKIPERTKERVKQQILAYTKQHYRGNSHILNFVSANCYVILMPIQSRIRDDYPPPEHLETREEYRERLRNTPTHLCRLRHFTADSWSVAFYTYSNEKYEPYFLANGELTGTPEECFEVGAVYLQ